MKTVVIVSADGEWTAVKALFPAVVIRALPIAEAFETNLENHAVTFVRGGWGKVSAAASTQFVIDQLQPDLIVNLGTCGGFEGRIDQGTIILVERTVIYDIIEQMTDADEAIEHYATHIDLSWLPRVSPTPVARALLISGDRDIVPQSIPELVKKYGAVAADWESGAIAWVADKNRKRLLILRGVTDLVGTDGGEAYGDYELYMDRTREIMRRLVEVLPSWLAAIENA